MPGGSSQPVDFASSFVGRGTFSGTMKWLVLLILLALLGGSWFVFDKAGKDMASLQQKIELAQNTDDSDQAQKLEETFHGLEGQRLFMGILMTFFCAGVVGIIAVVYLLPFFAQRVTHAVYDSAELVEKDVMHDARSLLAQGNYEGAIASFHQAAAADPLNRLPWVEIAKIYKDNLGNPGAAIDTIRHALESQAWEINDAAYFLFRLAELYDEVEGDRVTAVAILNQVIEQFPGTRHSANATHRLHEWAQAEEAAYAAQVEAGGGEYVPAPAEGQKTLEEEEAEFLARTQRGEDPGQQG